MSKYEKYEKYRVQNPTNASPNKYEKYAKYRISPVKQEESDPWLYPKSALKDVGDMVLDIPSLIGRGAEGVKNAFTGVNIDPVDNRPTRDFGAAFAPNWAIDRNVRNANQTNYSDSIPTGTDVRKGIKNFTGYDLEPHPVTPEEKIASDMVGLGTTFAVNPFGGIKNFFQKMAGKTTSSLPKLSTVVKRGGTGAAIGGTSAALKEEGVDPITADLSAFIGVPLGTKGAKNFFSNFTPSGYDRKLKTATGNILKESIGKKDISQVLQRLDKKFPLGADANTAELARNPGLARLHQTLAPNISEIAQKEGFNEELIKKTLKQMSSAKGDNPEKVGNVIRGNLFNNFATYNKQRSDISDPLFKKVRELTTPVPTTNIEGFIEKEGKYAKDDLEKAFNFLDKMRKSNASKGSNTPTDFEKFKKSDVYKQLGEEAKKRVNDQLTQADYPLPIELMEANKAISNKIGRAKRSGSNEEARVLQLGKKNILADMAHIPEEKIARSTFAELSKPINKIKESKFLHDIIKKDEFEKNFIKAPESINPLGGSLNDTRTLVKESIKNKKTINTIRASVVNKLLKGSELASINAYREPSVSYDKFNKFIKEYKPKLNIIFEKDQVKVLEEANQILRARNMVSTLGRSKGSNTQSDTTLFNALMAPADSAAKKMLRKIPVAKHVIPLIDAAKGHEQQQIKNLLEKALTDPQTAKLLLTPVNNIKDAKTLESLLYPAVNRLSREE